MNINAGGASASTMNNGRKDTTASDVQKLQEQLNDIKEQVKYEMSILFLTRRTGKNRFLIPREGEKILTPREG